MVEGLKNSLWDIQGIRDREPGAFGRRGSLAPDALPRLLTPEEVRQQSIELDREFQEELIKSVLGQFTEQA